MKFNFRKILYLLLRFGFGVLLIAASIDKIVHPFEFSLAVENYRVIDGELSRWVAVFLPYLEILTGVLLILGIWLDAAVSINAALMIVFLVLVGQAFARGLDISCGCFRIDEPTKIGIWKILENVGFAFGSLILLWATFVNSIPEKKLSS